MRHPKHSGICLLLLLGGQALHACRDSSTQDSYIGATRLRWGGWQVLCSVDSVEKALQEAKRVLRPGGRFVFVEHCLAPTSKPVLRIAQQVLNPIQIRLADGCHLNRNPLPLIKQTFQVQQAEEFILEGESMIAPHVAGWAIKST